MVRSIGEQSGKFVRSVSALSHCCRIQTNENTDKRNELINCCYLAINR